MQSIHLCFMSIGAASATIFCHHNMLPVTDCTCLALEDRLPITSDHQGKIMDMVSQLVLLLATFHGVFSTGTGL